MRNTSFILIAILFYLPCKSQNQAPEISNLNAWADTSNSQLHVQYDVADIEGDNLEIQLWNITFDQIGLSLIKSVTCSL